MPGEGRGVAADQRVPPVYFGQCGWDGFVSGGRRREHFRFVDSHKTGALKLAGQPEYAGIIVDDLRTSDFAGIVCVAGEHDGCRDGSAGCFLRAGAELWVSDGTGEGTNRVVDLRPGLGSADPRHTVAVDDGFLLFGAATDPWGRELWRSDGTEAGTRLVEDIHPGAAGSDPRFLTLAAFDNRVYFAADDG